MEYKKVSQQINDIVGDNVKKLAQVFPSAVKDGEVDFEALKEELGQFTEVGDEKYELTWVGKKRAKKIVQENPIGKTLKYIEEDSKNPETTENLYIEGDNLEVLKLIRQNYYGAIKMIYIDPPYNTGNDFVYNDSFKKSEKEYNKEAGILDEEGNFLVKNTDTNGRFHSNWLNMMYARLRISKDLLREAGILFVSIDEHEHTNIKMICDEIFGETSFVTDFIWQKKTGASDAKGIAIITEYILVYCKNSSNISEIFTKNKESYDLKRYKYSDEFESERGPYYIDNLDRGGLQYSDSLNYGIECPDGTIAFPNGRTKYVNDGWIWKWGRKKIEWAIKNKFIEFRKSDTKQSGWSVCYKNYLLVDNENNSIERAAPHKNMIQDVLNANAAKSLKELFGSNKVFSYSKPVELIMKLIHYVQMDDDIILDFFSGSATTAHAVMCANLLDNKNRKYIMIQIQEPTNDEWSNICEVGKERIRRAGDKILSENPNADIDTGFKVFRVDDTNIKWNSLMDMGQIDVTQLETTPDQVDFMPNAKDIDIVYELMLRQRNIPLSSKIEHIFGGVQAYLPLCG